MIRIRSTLLLIALASVAACSQGDLLTRLAPPPADRFAREFAADLQRGDTAGMGARVTPALASRPGAMDSLRALRRYFASGPIHGMTLVNAQMRWMNGATSRYLAYEMESAGGWTLVEMVLRESEGPPRLEGVNVTRLTGSLRALNAFTLRGKGVHHWLMLLAMIAVPLFCLWSAVRVATTPMPRRWGWAMVSLLGAGKLSLDWTTGAVAYQLINVQILGAGYLRSGLAGPWIMFVGFPAGALVALERRRRALARAGEPPPPAEEAGTTGLAGSA